MHPQDAELFSVMQTAEISKQLTRRKPARFDSEESKWVSQFMSRMVKSNRISKKTFKYYTKIMTPGKTGFSSRWYSYLERYTEVFTVSSRLQGKTDVQRLGLCLDFLEQRHGFVTKIGISDTESFSQSDGERVAASGFVGVSETEMNEYVNGDGFITDLLRVSCFVPAARQRLLLLRALQTFGFLLYEPETNIKPGEVGFVALIGQPEDKRKKAA